jgi:hypothetical protein
MADSVDTGPVSLPDAAGAHDLALLRRFEPILRFTRGEELYPTDVDWYVGKSSLWLSHADGRRELLAEEGKLDLDRLGEERTVERGAMLHLTFSDPLNLAQLSAFLLEEEVRHSCWKKRSARSATPATASAPTWPGWLGSATRRACWTPSSR